MRVDKSARSGGMTRISLIFYNIKVCCVYLLESPHWGDSNEYTKHTILNILKKIILNYPKSAAMGFFPGTQEQVQNSRGKRAISVRAIEVLLYLQIFFLALYSKHCWFNEVVSQGFYKSSSAHEIKCANVFAKKWEELLHCFCIQHVWKFESHLLMMLLVLNNQALKN